MPTNDELRAMAEKLADRAQKEPILTSLPPKNTALYKLLSEAAAMLRSILAEREAKIEALPAEFQTAIYSDVEGLYEK